MERSPLRGLVISDFHVGTLVNLLVRDEEEPRVEVSAAPFGQVFPTLMGEGPGSVGHDFALVWTRPEGVISGYAGVLEMQAPPLESILTEVDDFVARVVAFAERTGTVLVPTWARDPEDRGFGLLDLTHPEAPGHILRAMNTRLLEGLSEVPGVHVLDAERWVSGGDDRGSDPRLWHMAKVPWRPGVYRAAAGEVKVALRAMTGRSRKLLVLDLDDTLWGGIVGETGWEGLRLGGHDPVGEAYLSFQRAIRALSRRGVVLGIVSKNEERTALEALRSHPEMVLREEDFAGWRINWEDKAGNLLELVRELNLGLDSVVFIDDNPVERGRVREALPEVVVPDWPADPLLYAAALRGLHWFDQSRLSEEDRARAQSYSAERARRALRSDVGSMADWLDRLELTVEAALLDPSTLPRATQLLNRTNQMNLSTRRLSESEMTAWCEVPARRFWTFRVRDRFGDAGLTGLASIEVEGERARLVDFVLSCRVFGRQVEEVMLAVAAEEARARGGYVLEAAYLPTERNAPCLTFLRERSGMKEGEAGVYRLKLDDPIAIPAHVKLVGPA